MAKKRIDIDLGVNTSELDDAAAKVGELKKLSSVISIQYDIDGKPLDVVIDKSLNLQKQVKAITAELRKTKEGTAEFKLLSTALGDAQDGLARSNAKSRDLLASLQLIPGPIGQIATQLNGAIGLLKTFSSFSLKDLQFQFKETVNDFKDIYKGFFGTNEVAKETSGTLDDVSQTLAATTANATTTSNAVQQVSQQFSKLDANILNTALSATDLDNAMANLKRSGFDPQIDAVEDLNGKITENIISVVDLDGQIEVLTVNQVKAAATTKGLITSIDGLTVAEETAAVATKGLSATIKSALIASGIGIAILVIGALISKLYEMVSAMGEVSDETKAATKAVADFKVKNIEVKNAILEAKEGIKSKKDALKEYNDKLGASIGYAGSLAQAEDLMAANTNIVVESIRLRAMAQVLYGKSAEEAAKAITGEGMDPGFWEQSWNAIKAGGNVLLMNQNNIMSYVDNLKETQENVVKLGTAADELEKKAIENDKKKKKGLAEPPKDAGPAKTDDSKYQKLLADLDARIQLEINKENTSREELSKLLEKRAKMVEKHDKYSFKQSELLRQENDKKTQAALDEDLKRLQAYQSKVDDIRIAAIEDEEERQLEARTKKLYDDKVALTYDLEFQKRSKEEQAAILKNMEETTAMELLKIRDGFYMKKFQKDEEAFLKERELQTRVKEFELENGQTRIDQANDFNTIYGDNIFGNKGLKAQWEKYFVDLRQVYADEFVKTDERLVLEKEQLQRDFDEKKLTRESYEAQTNAINDKLIANREKNTQRQLELDKLEIDSKRANADMTIQVGERLASALSAIAGKNKKLQKAAALVEAGIAIARIVTDTTRAIIAFSASVAPLGPAGVPIAAAYAVKAKISGALGIATIIAQSIGKLKSIDDSDSGATEGGGGQQGNGLGRGYAQGGLIGGKRHAQGGTLIEAEQGEAIMTRGSVTMFAPLLSAMNQMGGGTSFSNMNVVRPDNPILSNPAQQQAPLIVKTYVVENELSSTQAKQARLKDLSTL